MPNQLASESSPYLLQHASNPVNWYPWNQAALTAAREQQKPIFLSIGYSACHWCHVMEHESFEDEGIAAYLNEHFISIKVDREERPDLDHIYMAAVQMLSGRGGWPMSVFLTPALQPFFGGTYWPPTQQRGMPGFDQVLRAVLDAWDNRREQAVAQAAELTKRIGSYSDFRIDQPLPHGQVVLQNAVEKLQQSFDSTHGGFGAAPKFPRVSDLHVMLRFWNRQQSPETVDQICLTLDKMASGGIYDHLGGGFARYSVDAKWLVPHFEKMLYDNAQLVGLYLDAFTATGNEHYSTIVCETCDYVLRDMTDPSGGFYSTEDADSEGVEGKFYVWTLDEIESVLGSENAEIFCRVYDVSAEGNFEGKNILNLPKSIAQCATENNWDVEEIRAKCNAGREKLLAARDERIHPGKDDKVLVSWSGLMIDSIARAGAVLGKAQYILAATKCADFILTQMRDDDRRLLHTWRSGKATLSAYLDDYAYLANALVTLYECTFDEKWIDHAMELVEQMRTHFGDAQRGGFYYTADDHEQLISRLKDFQDSSVPSGNAMAATVLVRLGKLTGRSDLIEDSERTISVAAGLIQTSPQASAQLLIALDMLTGPLAEIVIVGDSAEEAITSLRTRYLPNHVAAYRNGDSQYRSEYISGLFANRTAAAGELTVYVCENFACQAPVTGLTAILEKWSEVETACRVVAEY